jgi:hypothetical protein
MLRPGSTSGGKTSASAESLTAAGALCRQRWPGSPGIARLLAFIGIGFPRQLNPALSAARCSRRTAPARAVEAGRRWPSGGPLCCSGSSSIPGLPALTSRGPVAAERPRLCRQLGRGQPFLLLPSDALRRSETHPELDPPVARLRGDIRNRPRCHERRSAGGR